MKINYFFISCFALGFILTFMGALFKLQHYPGSNIIVMSAIMLYIVSIIGVIRFIYLAMQTNKKEEKNPQ